MAERLTLNELKKAETLTALEKIKAKEAKTGLEFEIADTASIGSV